LFSTPRPSIQKDEQGEIVGTPEEQKVSPTQMDLYIKKIAKVTGPLVFTEVLMRELPVLRAYWQHQIAVMTAEERLGILPSKGLRRKYLDSINFSPFSTFSKIGSQHSWEHAHYDSGDGLSTRHPVKRDEVHSWHLPAANAILTSNTPTENRVDKKSRIIVVLEDDAESLRSAMALAAKHPNDTLVYQRDLQGNMRKIFGDPATLSGDLDLLFVAMVVVATAMLSIITHSAAIVR